MASIVVLGCGMVGSAIARDLAARHRVLVADIDPARLESLPDLPNLTTDTADLSRPREIRRVINGCDMVVGAVPGFMGYSTLKTVLESGRNMVDISFFPEDGATLDALARSRGVTALVDFGVAPGMCHILAGYHHARMEMESYECLVGGLPKQRTLPFQYKAPFSPIDVLEEYTRPARFLKDGRVVVRPALSDPEYVEFPGIGTLEAFNTDGLRSLLTTLPIPNLIEKTLRYPGHIDLMRTLREMGLFGTEPVMVGKTPVVPLEFTSRLLFPMWKYEPGEADFTVMRIRATGLEKGRRVCHEWNLYDEYDSATEVSSMARTTGYTCCAGVELLLSGAFDRRGVIPPEVAGVDHLDGLLDYLRERGVVYHHEVREAGE